MSYDSYFKKKFLLKTSTLEYKYFKQLGSDGIVVTD